MIALITRRFVRPRHEPWIQHIRADASPDRVIVRTILYKIHALDRPDCLESRIFGLLVVLLCFPKNSGKILAPILPIKVKICDSTSFFRCTLCRTPVCLVEFFQE